jgi:hypothetical protein
MFPSPDTNVCTKLCEVIEVVRTVYTSKYESSFPVTLWPGCYKLKTGMNVTVYRFP